jgi:hypothetical protein
LIALLVRGLILGLGAGVVIMALYPLLIAGGLWISPVSDQVAPLVESYMTSPHIQRACTYRALCDYRVAHCPRTYARGFDPANLDEWVEHSIGFVLCAIAWLGR